MNSYKFQVLRLRAVKLIAEQRSFVVASSELGLRDFFKVSTEFPIEGMINLVYARVNARDAEKEGYTIHLNVLPEETSLKSLKCIKERPDNLVEPHHLAQELNEYLLKRDNKSGLLMLAIDRVHMLTNNKRNILASIFRHYTLQFAVVLIIPLKQWEFFELRHAIDFTGFLGMTTYQLKTPDDILRFLIDHDISVDVEPRPYKTPKIPKFPNFPDQFVKP